MKKIILLISALFLLSVLVVFNFYDLDISVALTKNNSAFYEFFDDYGELPIYFGPVLFGVIYFYLCKKPFNKLMSMGICGGAILVAIYKVFHNKEIEIDLKSVILILSITLVLFALILLAFYKVKKETMEKIKDLALVGLITTIVSILCVEALKLTWGRVRFRDLSSDYSEFTNLITINGYTGNKSFPSGHTNASTSILLISLIVPRFVSKKWIKNFVTGLCFAYIALVAFSRIVVGAHYASDVTMGFVVGLVSISLTYYILKRKGLINVTSDKC